MFEYLKRKITSSCQQKDDEAENGRYQSLLVISTDIQLENSQLRKQLQTEKEAVVAAEYKVESIQLENEKLVKKTGELEKENTLLDQKNCKLLKQQEYLEKEKKTITEQIEKLKEKCDAQEKALQNMKFQENSQKIDSAQFWNNIYLHNGTSGSGSYNRLAEFKAEVVNAFLDEMKIQSIAEIGCGDGNQLSLIHYPRYVGVDVSEAVIEKDRVQFQKYANYEFYHSLTERDRYIHRTFELTISMDVIFHLLEDNVFSQYIDDLFMLSKKYVVIYSSNHEEYTPWPEYRHRNFTGYVSEHFPNWKLVKYIPNKYPYKIGQESTTSASDFYIYQKLEDKNG